MPLLLITSLASLIFIISLYAAHKSYVAITNLRQYEERSERAAKYSETAAHQLYKTRVTQGSSAAAIAFSLASALGLLIRSLSSTPSSATVILLPSLLNVGAIAAAFVHNQGFWKAKAKVPFVEGFNEGIRKSQEIRKLLVWLGFGWGITGVVGWILG